MKRKIIAYEDYYKDFLDSLDIKTKYKVLYGLLLLETQDRLPSKYVKHIKDGIFELRIEYNSNIYRIFFCFDGDYIVILFNGFQKKTQKIPSAEIDRAIRLKKEYERKKYEENENL
ncbi:MAG: type II toxin-antitoxin system RelE/ParE family toxin [Tannerellaceae bacterium]|jgi:putative addiction module killer protein|nr:type II toxin-antitoxin system RelE/ParE family toxin [Tannerellaceae bacterium]